ncbi:MAG: RNA polymerase sigma-70 factor, partial [Tannerellaceae bacterium]|nr:RNA polymerase sigma-70 factor [Tannerellaceae bacterium]
IVMYADFKTLFLKYYYALCLYAYKIVQDMNVAEDLVQDVFFDTWEKRKQIDLRQPLKSYLYKATYHKCIDHIRQIRLREEKLNEPDELSFFDMYTQNSIQSQYDEIHINEIIKEINNCKAKLPQQCRYIFELSREENLKNKEIAELLDISIKAVEKQLTKALKEIRSHLIYKGLISKN